MVGSSRPARYLVHVTVGVTALVCGLLTGLGYPAPAFTAKVTNTASSATAATYFTCTSAALGESGTKSWETFPLADSGGLTTTAAEVSNGHTGKYSTLLNLGVTTAGVTFQQAGPCPRDGAKAETFDGASGAMYGQTGVTSTANQSDEVWFKTTTTAGGVMISSWSTSTPNSGGGDRILYMNTGGKVVFGTYVPSTGTTHGLASPLSYNNNAWHQAVAVLNTAAGSLLYIDGALVASNSSYNSANVGFTAYSRMGAGQLSGWPDPGGTASSFWAGSLAFGSIYLYAMTATQVSAHYRAGT